MSLLNKMLRDLEHRRADDAVDTAELAGVKAVEPSGQARRRPVLWLALVLAAAAGAAVFSQHLPGFNWSPKENRAPPVPKLAALADKSSAPGPAPAVVAPADASAAVTVNDAATDARGAPAPETTLLRELRIAADIETPIREPDIGTAAPGNGAVPVRAAQVEAGGAAPQAVLESDNGANTRESRSSARPLRTAPSKNAARVAIGESAVALALPSTAAGIDVSPRAPDARQRANDAIESGLQAFGRKQYVEAQRAFRGALELEPANDRGRQALLSALLATDDKRAAEAAADEGVLQGTAKVGFALVSARLKLERGAAKEAIAVLERERAAGARHADYQALWGNALSREARYAEAVQRYASAVELAPASAAHHVGLGYALRNDGQFASANAVFQSVAEMPGLSPQLADLVEQQLAALQRLVVKR